MGHRVPPLQQVALSRSTCQRFVLSSFSPKGVELKKTDVGLFAVDCNTDLYTYPSAAQVAVGIPQRWLFQGGRVARVIVSPSL